MAPLLVLAAGATPAGAVDDTTPPALVALSIAPQSIDASAGDQIVTLTAHLVDDLSGFQPAPGSSAFGSFAFVNAAQTKSLGGNMHPSDRVSGTALDGVYDFTLTVPRYFDDGTWTLDSFAFSDAAGNAVVLHAADLAAAGLPTTFEQTGPDDSTPPTLLSLSVSPTSVDVAGAAATITVTARLADDLAGLDPLPGNSAFGSFAFVNPSQTATVGNNMYPFYRVSGTALDGTYEFPVVVPQGAEQGTWLLDFVGFADRAGNGVVLHAADLAAAGFPNTFEVGRTATQVLEDVIELLAATGHSNSFVVKLEHAVAMIAAGEIGAACGQIGAFVYEVQAQSGKKVTAELAGVLVAEAQTAMQKLGCP